MLLYRASSSRRALTACGPAKEIGRSWLGVTVPRTVLETLVIEDKEPFVGDRSEGEIAGYKGVLQLIHERNEASDLSNNVILQFHRDLFKFVAGSNEDAWKTSDNSITERRPDGSTFVRFQPTPAWQTPFSMTSLYKAYMETSESEVDALILVALSILDFLCIHPFSDGSGRMVRLLAVLLLYREDYNVGRYISIERIIEGTKDAFYDMLYRSSQGWHTGEHDPMPWGAYFLGVIRAAYVEFSDRVGESKGAGGVKAQLVIQAINQYIGDFSISEIHQKCPTVGWDMLRHVIRSERDKHNLEAIGRG